MGGFWRESVCVCVCVLLVHTCACVRAACAVVHTRACARVCLHDMTLCQFVWLVVSGHFSNWASHQCLCGGCEGP